MKMPASTKGEAKVRQAMMSCFTVGSLRNLSHTGRTRERPSMKFHTMKKSLSISYHFISFHIISFHAYSSCDTCAMQYWKGERIARRTEPHRNDEHEDVCKDIIRMQHQTIDKTDHGSVLWFSGILF